MNHDEEQSKRNVHWSAMVDELAQKNKDDEIAFKATVEHQKKPTTILNFFAILGLFALFVAGFINSALMLVFIVVFFITIALFINRKNSETHEKLQIVKIILMVIAVIALVGLGVCYLALSNLGPMN